MTPFILSQILATGGFAIDFISFQFKKRTQIQTCFAISAVLYGIHFLLLDQYFPAIAVFIIVLRSIVAIFSSRKIFMGLFFILNGVMFWIVKDFSLIGILSLIGSLVGIIAAFQTKDKNMRWIHMISTATWISVAILVWSPVMILADIAFLTSNVVGYLRYYRKK